MMAFVRGALRVLLFAVTWTVVVAVVAIPILRASPTPRLVVMGTFAHLLFAPICHQQPDRCFWVAGNQMPVCARCAGVFFGLALGTLLALVWPANDLSRLRRLFAGAALFLIADWIMNVLALYKVDWLRWSTGAMLGVVASLVIMQGIATIGMSIPGRRERGVSLCTC